MTLVREKGEISGNQNKKFPEGNFLFSDAVVVFLNECSAELAEQPGLFYLLLFQVVDRFDFVDHFRVSDGFFDARLDEVLQQLLQLEEPEHFDDAAAEIRMKESVFPEGIKGPVNGFEFFQVAAVDDEAVRARFAQRFSGIVATIQNKNSRFRGWAVD